MMRTNRDSFTADAKILAHGKKCECCIEMNWEAGPVWARGFAATVDKETAELAWRVAPDSDYDLRYHGRNWRVAHNLACALMYHQWWKTHSKRKELHELVKAGPVHPSR
jgi:hypothetical protein